MTQWRQRQQELAKIILQDKDVESLSSFIGVDGTNTTPNAGRIQINLKPRDERADDASAIIRRLQPELAKVEGITLYMQPVQDLTVEDRVSRTQFQYSIEDADAQELAQWTPKLVDKLQTLPAVARCGHRPAQQRTQDEWLRSTGIRRRGWESFRRRSTTRCTTLSDSGRFRPSLRS